MILQRNKVFFFFFLQRNQPTATFALSRKTKHQGGFFGAPPFASSAAVGTNRQERAMAGSTCLAGAHKKKKKMASCKPHTTFQGAHDARAQNTHGAIMSHVSPSVFGVSQCTSAVTCTDALASTHNKHAHNNSHMHFALFVFT